MARLDLRLVAIPKLATTGDCGVLLFLAGSLRLDLREVLDCAVTTVSGTLISLDPLDTRRVWRRGDGLLSDDLRDTGKTSSFSGDDGRCTGLLVVW